MSLINDILTAAVKAKASDIHLNAGLPPMFRINTIVDTAPGFPIMDRRGARHSNPACTRCPANIARSSCCVITKTSRSTRSPSASTARPVPFTER